MRAALCVQKDARKLTHCLAGPGFLLTWPLFSCAPEAPLIAACIPGLNAVRLVAAGTGAVSAPGLVASVSRSKDRTELLQGPLIYCFVLIAATVLSWRDHVPGLCAVAMMCGGDGVADLVGRRIGKAKLPWNPGKSWAGSIAMLLAGFALMCGCVFQIGPPSLVCPYGRSHSVPLLAEAARKHVTFRALASGCNIPTRAAG